MLKSTVVSRALWPLLFSHVWLFATPWTTACLTSLSFTISRSLLKLMSLESTMTSNHLILCHPFSCPQSFPATGSFPVSHIRWPKYWSFSFSPSNKYSALISYKIDWFDLAVQGTLKSLLQHHQFKSINSMNSFAKIILCVRFLNLNKLTSCFNKYLIENIFSTIEDYEQYIGASYTVIWSLSGKCGILNLAKSRKYFFIYSI